MTNIDQKQRAYEALLRVQYAAYNAAKALDKMTDTAKQFYKS